MNLSSPKTERQLKNPKIISPKDNCNFFNINNSKDDLKSKNKNGEQIISRNDKEKLNFSKKLNTFKHLFLQSSKESKIDSFSNMSNNNATTSNPNLNFINYNNLNATNINGKKMKLLKIKPDKEPLILNDKTEELKILSPQKKLENNNNNKNKISDKKSYYSSSKVRKNFNIKFPILPKNNINKNIDLPFSNKKDLTNNFNNINNILKKEKNLIDLVYNKKRNNNNIFEYSKEIKTFSPEKTKLSKAENNGSDNIKDLSFIQKNNTSTNKIGETILKSNGFISTYSCLNTSDIKSNSTPSIRAENVKENKDKKINDEICLFPEEIHFKGVSCYIELKNLGGFYN